MAPGRFTLPHLITIGWILARPAVIAFVLFPSVTSRLLCFVLLLTATWIGKALSVAIVPTLYFKADHAGSCRALIGANP